MIATRNTEKMGRTAREMAEIQRDSYEAFTENLAAAQRRSIGLANGGLEFLRLQEDNTRAAQEWFANGVSLLELQRRNAGFVQGWMGEAVEAVREQSEHNVRTAEAFARGVSKQQEGLRTLNQGWVRAYRDFFSPLAYVQEGVRAFQRATQQVIRQGLEATEQVAQQGLKVAEEVTEHTEQVLRQSEEATREAQLRTAVFGALKITDYEGLSVAEISRRLEGLTIKQLEEIREYEKQNKNRETLIELIKRKKRAKNNSS